MKTLSNAILLLSVVACILCGIMLYEWTGLRLGGLFVLPATILLILFLDRTDNLPEWMK